MAYSVCRSRRPSRQMGLRILFTVFLVYLAYCLVVKKKHAVTSSGRESISSDKMAGSDFTQSPSRFNKTERIHHKEQKVILLWTGLWEDSLWGMQIGQHFNNELCHLGESCIITTDQSRIKEADAVVFHCTDQFTWPTIRYPDQIYTVFCLESPSLVPLDRFNRMINMTATYRLDSDLPLYYMIMLPKKNVSDALYVPKYHFTEKTKSVVWVSSNCNPASKRIEYINKLAEYIDVDKYGKCGNLTCLPRASGACYSMFEKKYKFYLSFENAICKDYVTEKLFYTLGTELIPVVLGEANYSYHAPKHSYINAMDFSSPKQLAEFLLKLGQDEQVYNEYFQYKTKYYGQDGTRQKYFCDLCNILHRGDYRRTSERDIVSWWSNGTCNNTYVPNVLAKLAATIT